MTTKRQQNIRNSLNFIENKLNLYTRIIKNIRELDASQSCALLISIEFSFHFGSFF